MYSIITVNYQSFTKILQMVDSIKNNIGDYKYEIIIVNNDITETESLIAFFSFDNNTKIIEVGSNIGFGKACNIGARYANHDYLLFINPDITLKRNVFNEINLAIKNNDPDIIGLTSTKYSYLDLSHGKYISIWTEFLDLFLLGRLYQMVSVTLLNLIIGSRYTDWVIGAFFIIKKETYSKLKGFHEDYFLYFEEYDLCYRAKQSNYHVFYIKTNGVQHEGGHSLKRNYEIFTYNYYLGKYKFVLNNYNGLKKYIVLRFIKMQLYLHILFYYYLFSKNNSKAKGKVAGYVKLKKWINNENSH